METSPQGAPYCTGLQPTPRGPAPASPAPHVPGVRTAGLGRASPGELSPGQWPSGTCQDLKGTAHGHHVSPGRVPCSACFCGGTYPPCLHRGGPGAGGTWGGPELCLAGSTASWPSSGTSSAGNETSGPVTSSRQGR